MRVGILTGGGDCPGLNAAIRAAVRHGTGERGCTLIGFRDGWRGVVDGDADELTRDDVRHPASRRHDPGHDGMQPHRLDGGAAKVREALAVHRLEGFIVIGGEGTIGEAARLDVPVIGIPKTIDNDILGTDASIGFHTAAQVATDLIDRLYSTAESHNRVMVCEVMGRHAGWIGYTAGVATGADVIFVPEHPFELDLVCRRIQEVHALRRPFSAVVVSEGAMPAPGSMALPDYPLDANGFPRLGGVGRLAAEEIGRRTGFETRVTVLGHVQRGGSPVAFDRVLATRLANAAIDAALDGNWASLVGLHGTDVAHADRRARGSDAAAGVWRIPEVLCA